MEEQEFGLVAADLFHDVARHGHVQGLETVHGFASENHMVLIIGGPAGIWCTFSWARMAASRHLVGAFTVILQLLSVLRRPGADAPGVLVALMAVFTAPAGPPGPAWCRAHGILTISLP